jgi:hypothetical protein
MFPFPTKSRPRNGNTATFADGDGPKISMGVIVSLPSLAFQSEPLFRSGSWDADDEGGACCLGGVGSLLLCGLGARCVYGGARGSFFFEYRLLCM